jgi:hypothetical protein
VAGATVEFKQSGTTIYSGTTGSSGTVTLSIAAGTYDRVVSRSPRFTTSTTSVTVTSGTTSMTVALSAASGYHCSSCCVEPLADTLYLSDSIYGIDAILQWNGTAWSSNNSNAPHEWGPNRYHPITYNDCHNVACPDPISQSGLVYGMTSGCGLRVSAPASYTGGYPCIIALGTDQNGAADFLTETFTGPTRTCPPSTVSIAFAITSASIIFCQSGTVTISETAP